MCRILGRHYAISPAGPAKNAGAGIWNASSSKRSVLAVLSAENPDPMSLPGNHPSRARGGEICSIQIARASRRARMQIVLADLVLEVIEHS